MRYDHGLKKISKYTGLTGVEAKHIAQSLKKQDVDFETVDWKTIGEDMYGYGSRTGSVKEKLSSMYGISLDVSEKQIGVDMKMHDDVQEGFIIDNLMRIHERRSKKSRQMDYRRSAKGTFKSTDEKGVKKWKKHPNRYDIIGIDDMI